MKYVIVKPGELKTVPPGTVLIGINDAWITNTAVTANFFTEFDSFINYMNEQHHSHEIPMCGNELVSQANSRGKFNVIRSLIRVNKLKFHDDIGGVENTIHKIFKNIGYTDAEYADPIIVDSTITETVSARPSVIDVLVVNLNSMKYTLDCVNDLLAQNYADFRITVYDNASTELGTELELANIAKADSRITVIRTTFMVHLNRIWNDFATKSTAKYLCYMNNDVKLPANYIRDTVMTFVSDANIGVVNHATNKKSYSTVKNELEFVICENTAGVDILRQGWEFTIRRDAYVAIPEKIQVYSGDDWLFYKLYEKGMKCAMVTSSPIIHYLSKSKSSRVVNPANDVSSLLEIIGDKQFGFNKKYSSLKPEYSDFIFEKNSCNTRNIAVLLQLYWVDLWPEFMEYIKNIPQEYDLYVAVVVKSHPDDVLESTRKKILEFKPNATVIFTENKGLDIGGCFMQMKHILLSGKKYSYYLKLHTKKSIDTREKQLGVGKGAEWRRELVLPICGSECAVRNSLNLLKFDNVGMVGAAKWHMNIKKHPDVLMQHREMITSYIKKSGMYGLTLSDCEFIGGTMFWVRGDIWENFFASLDIDAEYSAFDTGKYNDMTRPSLAHSMERMFGMLVKYNKLRIAGL